MRRLIAFPCADQTLIGSLDEAEGATGLLIVSGGNEVRWGAHRGMAMLAAQLADAGHPVFRFDRRGVGDSTGENGGFMASGPDIAAAAAAFRHHCPSLTRIIGFGNCDAATALALFHRDAGIDTLVLANPWVVEPTGDMPPSAAIRARYADRLRDPGQLLRLLRGEISIAKLFKGLVSIVRKPSQPDALADTVAVALIASDVPVTLLLAERDNTAISFADAWRSPAFAPLHGRIAVIRCDTDSHSFAREADKRWLSDQMLSVLQG